MRYIIVEDDFFAYKAVLRMMKQLRPDYQYMAWFATAQETMEMLENNNTDFIIADICLADGLSLDVFRKLRIDVPIIFTTGYEEYALKAFKLNSVDYLMKPVGQKELEAALEKMERRELVCMNAETLERLQEDLVLERVAVSKGDRYVVYDVAEAGVFEANAKYVVMHTFGGKEELINRSMAQLEHAMYRRRFMRVSRKHIVNIDAIKNVKKGFNGKLILELRTPTLPTVEVPLGWKRQFLQWIGLYS